MSIRRSAVPLLHAGLAFAFWPWIQGHPFSEPKLWLLAGGAVVAGLAARGVRPAAGSLLALAWIWFCRDSMLDVAAGVLFLGLLSARWDSEEFLRWVPWIGAAMACVVLAQWALPGARLRMFGTLGNPDFCAAWLTAALCTNCTTRTTRDLKCTSCTIRTWPRWSDRLPAVLMAAALFAIGSFGTVLALCAAALVAARSRKALGAIAAGALCIAAASRSPARVVEGRIELHQQALPHLFEAPAGEGTQALVHDDWLQLALEHGIPAALCLALLTLLALKRAEAPVAAAIASLAARAFVDFPLHRPAELALFVTLLALALKKEEPCPDSP